MHVWPLSHAGSHRVPAAMPGRQRKPALGAHTVDVRIVSRSLTVAQHPERHIVFDVHAGAQWMPPVPQSTQGVVAVQSSVPQRSIPGGAPVAHETSTQTPMPGESESSRHMGVPAMPDGQREPSVHGGPQ
ncbi:MAG: hypothetical protein U0326_00145 [Polyangiales bacterium]